MMTYPEVPGGTWRGVRMAERASSQGAKKNWMNANGSTISRKTTPLSSTSMEKMRPASLLKVMSPKPSVLITVSVQ
jgi:hypothetical protein